MRCIPQRAALCEQWDSGKLLAGAFLTMSCRKEVVAIVARRRHAFQRLRPGDQILEVMSENLRNVTHSHALQALRQTPNRVKLIIHREDDEIYETLEI